MHKAFASLAAGAALLAAPAAFAQIGADGVAEVNLVGQVGAKPGDAVGKLTEPVTDQVGKTVESADTTVNDAADATKLTIATREQVRAGAQISDASGNSVGTVQSVDSDNAVVVDGGKLYNVPLSSLYTHAGNAAHRLITKLPRAEIKARVQGGAAVDSR